MPAIKNANEVQFLFLCAEFQNDTFRVVNFSGTDRISTPYRFEITLKSSQNDITTQDLINQNCSLYMLHQDESYLYSGVILQSSYLKTENKESTYKLTMVPRLKLLDFNHQTRLFLKMSIPDVIKSVLDSAGLSDYYQIDTQNSYPQKESVLQYQESDLNFVSRLMEETGMWYYFREDVHFMEEECSVKGEALIISDNPSSYSSIPGDSEILFRSHSGMVEWAENEIKEHVNSLSCENRVVQKEVLVKNYNYRTPEVNLSSHKKVDRGTTGTMYHYGSEFSNMDEAESKASLLSDRIISSSADVTGESTSARFRAGMRFDLIEHEREECNDNYLLYSVTHIGGHGNNTAGVPTYSNHFVGVSSALSEKFRPRTNALTPKVTGVITATIEANGSEYASLDDMGRYKVRMPFDVSDAPNSEASKAIRLAQPYSGADYGIHFPSHEGAEMILACIDGNPNRPIGLGTVPNANTTTPVSSANSAQSIIRTAGKNEILMDDTSDKQKIKISSAAQNSAVLDDQNKQIYLQTTDGNKLHLDDKNECASWNAKGNNISMSYKSGEEGIFITTGKGHVIKVDDAGKCVTIKTKNGHNIQLDDDGGTIVLSNPKEQNTVTLDESKGLILDSKKEISIKATKDVNIEGANIKISSSSGNVDVKAAKDLSLAGMNISESAKMDLAMEGTNTSMKAKMKAEMEGKTNAEVKSGLQAKVNGTTTEISGSAMATVKGGVVMVN
ncbi:MAG: type VI secretion system Vgr family protein [Chitinispirillaceae bacterium]